MAPDGPRMAPRWPPIVRVVAMVIVKSKSISYIDENTSENNITNKGQYMPCTNIYIYDYVFNHNVMPERKKKRPLNVADASMA